MSMSAIDFSLALSLLRRVLIVLHKYKLQLHVLAYPIAHTAFAVRQYFTDFASILLYFTEDKYNNIKYTNH